MRILKLRLCNLNSLSGAWEIDFTHPEYVNEGLFAITGATGAGKTTILDAICLALYGQTPRLGRITKSDNDIMSRQHGDCWAEVCFATEQGEYRAKWYQHRARRSPEGALQQAQHTLSELATGTIIEESLSAVPGQIETLSGLNFDRFMRSMMLAQGQFAAFLNAKESERSELLEQLTGTDIYAQISKRVFARSKAEKDKLASLKSRVGDIRLLSDDESKQLAADIAAKQELVKQLTAEKEEKKALADWVSKLAKARKEAEELVIEHQALARAQADFAHDQARLEQDRQVRPYATDLKQHDYFVQQQQRNQGRQQELEARLKAIQPQLAQAKKQLDAAEQAHREQQNAWKNMQTELDKARQADVQIGLAERDHKTAKAEAERLANELNTLQASEEKQNNLQNQLQQELQQSNQWLEANSEHATLITQLALIQRDHEAAVQLEAKVKELRAQRDALRQDYTAMAAMPLAENQQNEVETGEQRITALQNELQVAQREAEQHRLQQLFAEQRHVLEEGKACPLCGALEHPLVVGEGMRHDQDTGTAATIVAGLSDQLDQARDALQGLKLQQAISAADQQRKLDEFKQKGEQFNRAIEETRTEQRALVECWIKQVTAWQLAYELNHEDSAQHQLQHLCSVIEQAAKGYQQKHTQQQTCQQQLAQSEQALKHLTAQRVGLQNRIEENNAQQKITQDVLQQVTKTRQQYFDGRPVRDVEQAQQQTLDDTAQRLEEIQRSNQALNENRVELESEKRHLDESQMEIKTALEAILSRLQEALAKLGLADIETLGKRLLEDKEHHQLTEQADSLRARGQKLELAQQRNQQDISTAGAEQPADSVLNQQRLDAVENELNLVQRDIGALNEQQRQDTQARARYQDMLEQVNAQQAVCDNWATLDGMIGSADGKKYRNFAQGLTFEIMIDYANDKLQKMSDRYLLVRDTDAPLALNVIDDYQGGEVRSTRNLSGGESFIVSLALALGLAQMASSRVRVDSLFLDEGFGTLDPDTLDVALDTLASLRQDGKMIGLISHVGALKERIATQLQVDAGAAGRSRLQGPGVRELEQA